VGGEEQGEVNPDAPWSLHAPSTDGVASVDIGQAASLGSLSVPSNWATAASEVAPVPISPSASSVNLTRAAAAADDDDTLRRGFTYRRGLMAMMNGQRASALAPDQDEDSKDAIDNEATRPGRHRRPNNEQTRPGRHRRPNNEETPPGRHIPVAALVSANGRLRASVTNNDVADASGRHHKPVRPTGPPKLAKS
jgi:hypothetical protein